MMHSTRPSLGVIVESSVASAVVNLAEFAKGGAVGHADGLASVSSAGSVVGIVDGARLIVARVASVGYAEPKRVAIELDVAPLRQMQLEVLGTIRRKVAGLEFSSESALSPPLGASVVPMSEDELRALLTPRRVQADAVTKTINLGISAQSDAISIDVDPNIIFGRHMAILGSSGQGKTHFAASVMQDLLKNYPNARIVVLDVNDEYKSAFEKFDQAKLKYTTIGYPMNGDPENSDLKIPYYAFGRHGLGRLLLPSERTQRPALRFAIDALKYSTFNGEAAGLYKREGYNGVLFSDCRSEDATKAYQAIELIKEGKATMAENWPDMAALACLAAEWGALKPDYRAKNTYQRSAFDYGHISPLLSRIDNLIDDEQFCRVVETGGGKPAIGNQLVLSSESKAVVENLFGSESNIDNWNVHVISLKRVVQDLMPHVVGALLETFADVLFQRGPGKTHPTFLVLEEAHHYLRQLPGDAESAQHALAYERLAKEGRKFGLSLCVSTQRPSELSPTVLAQCGTWAVFRLTNDSDRRAVEAATEGSSRFLTSQLPGLGRGQCLLIGDAVSLPTKLKSNRPSPEPTSADPPFVKAWSQ